MSRFFEELDYQPTPIGPISLRRRRELRLDVDVLEIMLGDEHLMSDRLRHQKLLWQNMAWRLLKKRTH